MPCASPARFARLSIPLAALLFAATARSEITPDAKAVLDRFLEASGRQAIAGETSTRIQGTISAFGLTGTASMVTSRPDRRGSTLAIGPITVRDGFDGATAWRTDPGTGKLVQLDGKDLEEARASSYFDNELYLLADQGGGRVTLSGQEKDSTATYTVLEMAPPIGRPRKLWFNGKTGLLDRITTKRDQLAITITLSDYRKVAGRLLAFDQLTQIAGMSANDVRVRVDSVWVNETLPDSLFRMPGSGASAVHWLGKSGAARLPFDYSGRHVWIKASVNGGAPADFIYDTGASLTVIDSAYAASIGLERMGEMSAAGAGSQGSASLSRIASLRVAGPDGDGVEVKDSRVALLSINKFLAPFFWRDCAGIIGYDFISRFVNEIDFDAETLVLHDPKTYRYEGKGAHIPFRLAGTVPVVAMKIDGEYAGDFRVDVGSGSTVDLHAPFVARHQLASRVNGGIEVMGGGFGGTFRNQLVRMKKIEIGEYSWERPLVSLSKAEGGAFTSEDYAGNIGTQILERFKVVLDYDRREMILEPGKRYGQADGFSRSGVQLARFGDSIKAMQVLDGSPAAKAGLREGDEVVSLDGKPILSYTADDVGTMFDEGKVGRKIPIEVRRDGKKEKLTLTLREIL